MKKGRCIIVVLFAIVWHYALTIQGQGKEVDSLYVLLNKNEIPDSSKVNTLNRLSELIIYFNPDSALSINSKSIEISLRKNLHTQEASSYFTRATLYFQLDYLDSAKSFSNRAIDIYTQLQQPILLGKSYNILGSIALELEDHNLALKSLIKGLEQFKSVNHKPGIAASLNRVGIFYAKREDYESARKYFEESLPIFTDLQRTDQVVNILNNIGVSFFQEKKYDKALEYYFRSLNLAKENSLNEKLPVRELNIGKTYKEMKDFSSAAKFLNQSLASAEAYSNNRIICLAILHLGILEGIQNKHSKALKHLTKGLDLAIKLQDKDTEAQYYQHLSSTYAALERYPQAYKNYLKFDMLKDSLTSISRNNEILVLQNQFEARQNEQKIAILQHAADKKNIIIYAVLIGTGLLILSFFLIIVNYKNKQKSLNLIHLQKEEISRQKINDLLKDQELISIRDKLEGQENERKRIAQELHDGVGGTLASIKMALLKLYKNTELKQGFTDIVERLDLACEEVRTVSHNLIPPVFHNSPLTDVIKEFVREISDSKEVNIYYEFYPKQELETISKNVQVDIYRIIQELLTNAIKHADASEINLYLTKHDDYINLMVEDDGKGFQPDMAHSGIGLKNIQSRVTSLKGSITIDSNPGAGTTVTVDLALDDEKYSASEGIPESSDFQF